jgi:hypothetical protein
LLDGALDSASAAWQPSTFSATAQMAKVIREVAHFGHQSAELVA